MIYGDQVAWQFCGDARLVQIRSHCYVLLHTRGATGWFEYEIRANLGSCGMVRPARVGKNSAEAVRHISGLA